MTVANVSSSTSFAFYAQTMRNSLRASTEQPEQCGDAHKQPESQSTPITNDKDYFASLSYNDFDSLLKAHSLTSDIDPDEFDLEGALNLLKQPGEVQAIDDDAFIEIGKTTKFVFPPSDAPQNVKDAWEETSANMSDEEKRLVTGNFMMLTMTSNIQKQGDKYVFTQSDEQSYVNPFSADASYKDVVNALLNNLEQRKNYIPTEKYEDKKQLLTDFANAMEKHGVS